MRLFQPDGTIRGYRRDEYNVDRLNTGKVLFVLYEKTGEAKYKRALDLLRSQLDTHPRTPSGGFWHKQIYPNQMWLDGIYMADAFYAQYESVFPSLSKTGESPGGGVWDDITRQIILIEQHTRDPETGLLYHAWDESQTTALGKFCHRLLAAFLGTRDWLVCDGNRGHTGLFTARSFAS